MRELNLLFPIPISKVNLNYKLSEIHAEELFNVEIPKTIINDSDTYQGQNSKILDNPIFFELKQKLQEELNNYVKQIFDYTCEIYITHSWINLNPSGTGHAAHTHTNSVFSGVYYLIVPPDCGPGLTFYNPRTPMFNFIPNENNMYNSSSWNINVSAGDLLLFPSEIYHGVNKNKSQSPRVTLGFNTFVRGHIGEKNQSNYNIID
jgi:uncharacterized protein (TIGR02466 family)